MSCGSIIYRYGFFCIFALDVVMDYAMVKTNPGNT